MEKSKAQTTKNNIYEAIFHKFNIFKGHNSLEKRQLAVITTASWTSTPYNNYIHQTSRRIAYNIKPESEILT